VERHIVNYSFSSSFYYFEDIPCCNWRQLLLLYRFVSTFVATIGTVELFFFSSYSIKRL